MNISNSAKSHKTETRLKQIKSMHELMTQTNDEAIYMTWIMIMSDQPSEEDFRDIAEDDEQFNDCFEWFVKLIQTDGYL